MLGARAQLLTALAVWVAAAWGSGDFVDGLQHDFKMGVLLPRQQNLQTFQGALGGVKAAAITQSNDPSKPFQVDGETFNDLQTAVNRACDNQHNECAKIANSKKGTLTVGDCDKQNEQCKSNGANSASATASAANTLVSSNADFDFFCDL